MAPEVGFTEAPPNWTNLSVLGRFSGLMFACWTFFTADWSWSTFFFWKVV